MLSIIKKTSEKSWQNNLNLTKIDEWLNNFTGEVFQAKDEQRIALWLLCNFTYYNLQECQHLCRIGHNQVVHTILVDCGYKTDIGKFLKETRFIAMGDTGSSGQALSYYYRQEAKLSEKAFCAPEVIGKDVKNIVCIDDMIISGGTAERFYTKHKQCFFGKRIYCFALLSTQEANTFLRSDGLKLVSPIIMDDRNRMFTESSLVFYRYPTIRLIAKKMVEHYEAKIEPGYVLGYKSGQYAVGLFNNTPNNSLPIFWSERNWTPIFRRKVKYKNEEKSEDNIGRFI